MQPTGPDAGTDTAPTDDAVTDPASETASGTLVDEPVWPHLRLAVAALDGTPIDADGIVRALFRQRAPGRDRAVVSPPPTLPSFDTPIGITEVTGDLAGHWTSTASGQVQATGLATLIYPTPGCLWSPRPKRSTFMPRATPCPPASKPALALSAEIWIAITLGAEGDRPAPPRCS